MPRPNAPGWLVVLEGIDGSGKSTVLRRLAEYCASRGLDAVVSSEPTRGQWGMKLRQSMTDGRLTLDEELALFLKDRAEHVETLIRPALEAGKVALLDRYYFSTAAYQGARGVEPEKILVENEKFAPEPDLVILLDFDPAAGLDRIRARGDAPNHFEQLEQLQQVRQIFLTLDRACIRKVDAAQPADAVGRECVRLLEGALG